MGLQGGMIILPVPATTESDTLGQREKGGWGKEKEQAFHNYHSVIAESITSFRCRVLQENSVNAAQPQDLTHKQTCLQTEKNSHYKSKLERCQQNGRMALIFP